AVLLAIGAAAFAVGLVIVRVPGIAFGMLTLAIGQMFYLLATRARGITGGSDGMGVPWPTTLYGFPEKALRQPETLFMITWVALVLVALLLHLLLKMRFGAVTEAIRDNEERARFIGIRTTVPRAAVYAISAVVSAIAGLLSNYNSAFASPDSLHWSVSDRKLGGTGAGGVTVAPAARDALRRGHGSHSRQRRAGALYRHPHYRAARRRLCDIGGRLRDRRAPLQLQLGFRLARKPALERF